MKLIRNAVAGGMLAGSAAVVACSGQLAPTSTAGGGRDVPSSGSTTTSGDTGSNPGVPNPATTTIGGGTGSVEVLLTVAGDTQVRSFTYRISGGPGATYGSFTETTGDAQPVEWVSGGIAAGCGYTIAVSGDDSTGDTCSGTSVSFCVLAGQISSVSLRLACTVPTDSGSTTAIADAQPPLQPASSCPRISGFSIMPAAIAGSQTAALSVTTEGNSSGTIVWTATSSCADGGSIGGFVGPDGGAETTDPNVTFDCGTCAGTVLVRAQAQLDSVPAAGQDASTNDCSGAPFTSISSNVICEGETPSCPAGTVLCGDSLICTDTQTDPYNCGGCGNGCDNTENCVGGVCAAP